jgi:PAS domain S-box-containing protein
MNALHDTSTIRILFFGNAQHSLLSVSDALPQNAFQADFYPVETYEALSTSLAAVKWDALLVPYNNLQQVVALLRRNAYTIPLIVICNPEEELLVLSTASPEITDVVSTAALERLNFALQRLTSQASPPISPIQDLAQFLQTALDAFPAHNVILSPEGTILSANESWQMFTHDNGSLSRIGHSNYLMNCEGLISADALHAAAIVGAIRTVIAGERDNLSIEYAVVKSQHPLWLRVVVTAFQEPTPRRVVISHVDITERKLGEATLREAVDLLETHVQDRTAELNSTKERVEGILNNSLEGIVLVDADLTIQQTNLAFNRLFNDYTEGYIGQSLLSIVHPDDASLLKKKIQPDPSKQKGTHLELRALGPKGESFDAEFSIGYITAGGLVCTISDITERKQAEKALKAYATEVEEMYYKAPIGYHSLNENGIFAQINDTELRWLGYTRDEVIGKLSWFDILAPESLPVYRESFDLFKQQGVVKDLEFDVICKDGKRLSALLSEVAVYDDSQRFLMTRSTFYDISDRKKAERALQLKIEEDREFQSHLKALHDITMELTVIDDLNGFYRRAVELGLQQLGFERIALFLFDPLDGSAIGTFGTDTNGLVTDEHHVRLGANRSEGLLQLAFNSEDRFFFAENTRLYTQYQEESTGWNAAAIVRNGAESLGWLVTDNAIHHEPATKVQLEVLSLYALTLGTLLVTKRTNAALRESESRYRLLANNVTDAITRITIKGEYLYVSPSVRSVLGYLPEELVGKYWQDFVHPDDTTDVMAHLHSPVASGIPIPPLSYRMRRNDGEYIWVESTAQAIYHISTDELIEFVMVSRDISERKRVEQALQQALEKEKELGELKSRFVSMASHEFRTPLTTILATTETLSAYRHKMDEQQIEHRLDKIREQVGYLKDVMEDVLLLAQMQARRVQFNPTPINLNELVQSVMEEYQNHPESTHQLIYTGAQTEQIVKLDKKLMRQILSNIISNAIKYSPAGKLVNVYLDYIASYVNISVRDEGIGIPEADQKRLFEAFHRATNVGNISGTGLGLVIAKESVDLHGGTITVESQVGNGTCFTISIPIPQ